MSKEIVKVIVHTTCERIIVQSFMPADVDRKRAADARCAKTALKNRSQSPKSNEDVPPRCIRDPGKFDTDRSRRTKSCCQRKQFSQCLVCRRKDRTPCFTRRSKCLKPPGPTVNQALGLRARSPTSNENLAPTLNMRARRRQIVRSRRGRTEAQLHEKKRMPDGPGARGCM